MKHLLRLGGVIALLAGCALLPSAPTPIGRLSLIEQEVERAPGQSAALVVKALRYQTQAVPGSWTSADLTLSNASLMASSQSMTIPQAGGSGIASSFTRLRPGSGYALDVSLKDGASVVATGSASGITLAAGTNSVTVSMSLTSSKPTFGIITTFAGTGTTNWNGDGLLATATNFWTGDSTFNFGALAHDASGNLYVTDTRNHRIRKIDATTLTVSTIAGTGTIGNAAEDVLATAATLNYPTGLLIAGNSLYFSDSYNHAIKRIDLTTNRLKTYAGTPGTSGFSGDGGPATSAKMSFPGCLARDASGSLYFIDGANKRIRKVDATTGDITTIAGNGVAISASNGSIASSSSVSVVYSTRTTSGIVVNAAGDVIFAETPSNKVRKIDHATGRLSTVAGNGSAGTSGGDGGPATSAGVYNPLGLLLDEYENLYISSYGSHTIRVVDRDGIISAVAGTAGRAKFGGDGAAATLAFLNNPASMTFDPLGNLLVLDGMNYRIRKVARQ
ncbi:hypothetical protein J7643_01600 [bacterium]|nr:hypothetical protein [bacterium]